MLDFVADIKQLRGAEIRFDRRYRVDKPLDVFSADRLGLIYARTLDNFYIRMVLEKLHGLLHKSKPIAFIRPQPDESAHPTTIVFRAGHK